MQTNKLQPPTQSFADQVNAGLVIPIKILMYLFAPFIGLLINIPVMNAVWRERREMDSLTNEHITDIGINMNEVRKEMKRGYFDIPCERRVTWNFIDSARSSKRF